MYSYYSSIYSYRCLYILIVVYVFLSLSMYSYCCLCILIVRPCILIVVYIFLLLSMYSYRCLCILIVVYVFLLFVHIFLSLSMYTYCCLCILIVLPYILIVVYVYLLLSMYSYCSSMYSYRCLCILIVVHVFLDAATLTEVFPCFFLGCKANARVKLARTGHGPHSSNCCIVLCIVCFVSFYLLFVCKCVHYYHRVTTQLQLTNISIMFCIEGNISRMVNFILSNIPFRHVVKPLIFG